MIKNILHIVSQDTGGAGEAVTRIHKALLQKNILSKLLLKQRSNTDKHSIAFQYPTLDNETLAQKIIRWAKKFLRKPFKKKIIRTKPVFKYYFYNYDEKENYISAKDILKQIDFKPDVIIVYWISYFCNMKTIYELYKLTNAKIVFMPMDMSIFTGGCHYAWQCKGYEIDCNNCPALPNHTIQAKENLEEKIRYIHQIPNFVSIACTEHIEKQMQKSALLGKNPIYKVFLTPDRQIFRPIDQQIAREIFSLPKDKKLILFGAQELTDERKGFNYLKKALEILKKEQNFEQNLEIILAGVSQTEDLSLPFKHHFIEKIKDNRLLALLYNVVDVFVCASVEDSGPMMINESICCGVPVLAFEMGVAWDLVISEKTGYRAKLCDEVDLAKGLVFVLSQSKEEMQLMKNNCLQMANEKLNLQIEIQKIIECIF
jgi:glycosyltransferase involved in cell wall biosynthesis